MSACLYILSLRSLIRLLIFRIKLKVNVGSFLILIRKFPIFKTIRCVVSLAITVAVLGVFSNIAISPKKSPRVKVAKTIFWSSCLLITSTDPDFIMNISLPGSPCLIIISSFWNTFVIFLSRHIVIFYTQRCYRRKSNAT